MAPDKQGNGQLRIAAFTSHMSNSSTENLLAELLEAAVGIGTDYVSQQNRSELERMCQTFRQKREFENAAKDFITIVLTSPLFRPGEEALRVELLKIPQLAGGREWTTAIGASDEKFQNSRLARPNIPLLEVLTLLRATRRSSSQTEDARMFMLHGRQYPTEYPDPEHQRLFREIVESVRKAAKESGKGQS